jgi:maltose alpha-D-glucosyltransferase / alpha-amylase
MHTRTPNLSRGRRHRQLAGTLALDRDWSEVFAGSARDSLTDTLQKWLPSRRWFRGKARVIESVSIREQIDVPMHGQLAVLVLFEVRYAEGEPELYVLPLACAFDQEARDISRDWPQLILAHVSVIRSGQKGMLYDAIVSKDFCHALLELTAQPHKVAGQAGDLEAKPTSVLHQIRREQGLDIESSVSKAEQSNSSIIYKGTLILKFFRRLDWGINPELEMERFLSARKFPYSPPLAGALEYHDETGRTSTVAVMTSFIPGCHDAWADTLTALTGFYKRVRSLPARLKQPPPMTEASVSLFSHNSLPQRPADLIGSYLDDAGTLGRRTAALHLALASDPSDPAFKPEPWTNVAQRNLVESLQELTRQNFKLLGQRLITLPANAQALAQKVLPLEAPLNQRFVRLADYPFHAERIRNHGDYHLGQVLHLGRDFLIIDFEGEPAISLEDRRSKQSALRDVAGMIYSFFYAANAGLGELPRRRPAIGPSETMAAWARYWSVWVGAAFLKAYRETAGAAPFVPALPADFKAMLDAELLRKAIYELGYELNNRPDWAAVTFRVLLDLLNPENPI